MGRRGFRRCGKQRISRHERKSVEWIVLEWRVLEETNLGLPSPGRGLARTLDMGRIRRMAAVNEGSGKMAQNNNLQDSTYTGSCGGGSVGAWP